MVNALTNKYPHHNNLKELISNEFNISADSKDYEILYKSVYSRLYLVTAQSHTHALMALKSIEFFVIEHNQANSALNSSNDNSMQFSYTSAEIMHGLQQTKYYLSVHQSGVDSSIRPVVMQNYDPNYNNSTSKEFPYPYPVPTPLQREIQQNLPLTTDKIFTPTFDESTSDTTTNSMDYNIINSKHDLIEKSSRVGCVLIDNITAFLWIDKEIAESTKKVRSNYSSST